jgi:DNA-binding MarR family transcriptional regulator
LRGSPADELRSLVQRFIREIGLLAGDQTPCGKPLPVSHAHALMVLLEHRRAGRKPTQQELGRVLRIDKSNVARLCRKMERAGQLVQEQGREDGRTRLLVLTERGARLASSVEQASRQRFQQLIDAVGPERRETVLAGLALLNDALGTSAPRGPSRAARRREAPAA